MRSNAGIAKQFKGRSPELFGRSVGRSLNAAFPCHIKPAPVCLRTDACIPLNPKCLAAVLLSSRWIDYSRTPRIRKRVIRFSNYPDLLSPSGKFVENSTKLTCLEITGYLIEYSTVLWLIELTVRRGREV